MTIKRPDINKSVTLLSNHLIKDKMKKI